MRLYPLCSAALLTLGCTGSIGDAIDPPGGETGTQGADTAPRPSGGGRGATAADPPAGSSVAPGAPAADCRAPGSLAPVRVRRLTHGEYAAVVRDLLGVSVPGVGGFPIDPRPPEGTGFDTQADALRVAPALLESYLEGARAVADAADLRKVLPAACQAPARAEQAACAAEFVRSFGKRAFRRPLSEDEARLYRALFDASVSAGAGWDPSVRFLMRAFLGSPHFLHRTEVGAGVGSDGNVRLSPHEVASALSFALWGTGPDAALMAAADAGRLVTREQIGAEARRLLADPRAKTRLEHFFGEWFMLEELTERTTKDLRLYPGFDEALLRSMRRETEALMEAAAARGPGGLEALLLDRTGLVDRALARVYGLSGTFGDQPTRTPLSATERAGVLTRSAFLAANAYQDSSSPVHRGVFVRRHLLCATIPDPPPGIPVDAVKPQATLTTRDRFHQHQSNPGCAACHKLIDPIGYAFETYDAIGRYRTTENGRPIDARGEIIGSLSTDGSFDGAVQLSAHLARSAEVAGCASLKLFRFALGRAEREADACHLREVGRRFVAAGGDFLALFAALTESDLFTLRAPAAP